MKIIILGAGRRGLRLANTLSLEDNDITIIDTNEKQTDLAMARIDCIAYSGNGISLSDLEEAGVRESDVFIAITGNDEINLISTAMAKDEFKIPQTICSVKNLSLLGYRDENNNSLLGINHIVNPDEEIASHIYTEIVQGVFKNTISFNNFKLLLYTVELTKDFPFHDLSIKDINEKIKQNFIIAAILRNNKAIIPSGNTKLKIDDLITFVAKQNESRKILSNIGVNKTKAKKVVIVGGNQTTNFLLNKFTPKERSNITLIDRNKTVCEKFAQDFPEILVVNGNITDEEIFKECNLFNFDLLIAITDSDELNIIVASYAKQVGISYSMALIKSNNNYIRMAKHLNIDDVISTQKVAVDSITRYLHGDNVKNIHSLFDGQMQSIELILSKDSPVINKQLKSINMKGKGIIAGIIKNDGNTIIPNGTYKLEENDKLIIITTQKAINHILGIF
ncbi:MAG: Trk system potassium transporter TrkA [Pleomorphochaeta sp.]